MSIPVVISHIGYIDYLELALRTAKDFNEEFANDQLRSLYQLAPIWNLANKVKTKNTRAGKTDIKLCSYILARGLGVSLTTSPQP